MFIYVKRNRINGKHYVGQTQRTVAKRWAQEVREARRGDTRPINNAIRKYGLEAFQDIMQCRVENKATLDAAEKAFISSFNSKVPNGYNLTDGGEGMVGYKHSEETRRHLREVLRGKPQTP